MHAEGSRSTRARAINSAGERAHLNDFADGYAQAVADLKQTDHELVGAIASRTTKWVVRGQKRRVVDAIIRAMPMHEEIERKLAPIRAQGSGLMRGDLRQALGPPSDAERHAARRLDLHPAEVRLASRVLWGHPYSDEERHVHWFDAERDRRIGDVAQIGPRSLQARRGLVTRAMLAELRVFVAAAEAAYSGGDDTDA